MTFIFDMKYTKNVHIFKDLKSVVSKCIENNASPRMNVSKTKIISKVGYLFYFSILDNLKANLYNSDVVFFTHNL